MRRITVVILIRLTPFSVVANPQFDPFPDSPGRPEAFILMTIWGEDPIAEFSK
jgi:hypothetical protein